MATNNILKLIKEGQAQVHIPKTVFYNPVQEFNRDLSVLVLRTFLKNNVWHHRSEEKHVKARGGMKILDALSASGLRSIRYAKELGYAGGIVKKIVANDLSQDAVDLINKNIESNQVSEQVMSSLSDANTLLNKSSLSFEERFHVIDLDPFGSGAQFFDAAVRSIGEAGLLMVTCTDTAVLCGNASESCFARYGSMSVRAEFCHEAALRIILRSLESHAAVYGRYIKPLLSISVDFYVRLFLQVYTQQAETKKSASKLSQVFLCKECKTPQLNPLGTYKLSDDPKQAKSQNHAVKYKFKPNDLNVPERCEVCQGRFTMAGPIWSEAMHDHEFLALMKQELALSETKKEFATFRRIQGMVYMCDEELTNPLFHSIDTMSSILRIKMPRAKDVMSALANEGYKVSFTHTNQRGIKTDAPSQVVWDIFRQKADEESLTTTQTDHLAARIMKRARAKEYSFEHNPKIEVESQKLSLLRFQMNPSKEWGPKPRPSGRADSELTKGSRPNTVDDASNDKKSEDNFAPVDGDTKRIKLNTSCESSPR